MSDTDLFRRALAEYQRNTGDKRGFLELPPALKSQIIARAQYLKTGGSVAKKPNWMGTQRARIQSQLRAEQDRSWKFRFGRKKAKASGVPRSRASSGNADVVSALTNLGYTRPVAKQMATRASSSTGSSDFDILLRTALKGKNPMAGKKKSKRKGKMPAALKAYWAAKRRQKNGRKKVAKRTVRAKPRKRAVAKRRVRNYRRRPAAAPKRRLKRNPPVKRPTKLRLNVSLGPKAKRSLASFIRRATGRRVRVQ